MRSLCALLVLALPLTLHAAPVVCPGLSTTAPATYPVSGVSATDIDGDGNADVIADYAILYGRGDGTFESVGFPPELSGFKVQFVADMNGDGREDLVGYRSSLLPSAPYDIVIVPNNGKRSFGPAINAASAVSSPALLVADVTKDGRPDIVSRDRNFAAVLINEGGRFSVKYSGVATPDRVVIADVDEDGDPDLVSLAPYPSDNILVQRGNGLGAFEESFIFGVRQAGYVVAADIDQDQRPEVITLNPNTNLVSIYRTPLRSGILPVRQISHQEPVNAIAADFNRDGRTDLAILGYRSAAVYLGDGHGNLTPAAEIPVAGFRFGAADFNGDGVLDLFIPSFGETTGVVLGNGDGTFRVAPVLRGNVPAVVAAAADFDGDGIDELISVYGSEMFAGRQVTRYLYELEKLPVQNQGYPFRTQAIAVGDVDQAAGLELIAADTTRVAVLSRASGQWVVTASYSTNVGIIDAVAVIDHRVAFVNDGVLKTMTVSPMEAVTVATFPRPGLFIVRVADIDRDGRQDLIVARSSIGRDVFDDFTGPEYFDGRIFVLYARADGTFASPEEVFDARTSSCCDGAIYDILAADFTGDGNPDIVAATLEKRLLLLTGNGKGAFVQSTIASRVAQIAARDVDGDGITDLAVSDRYAYLYDPRPGLSLYRGTTNGLSHHGTWLTGSELFLSPVIAQLRSGTAPALLISRSLTEATVIEFDCRTRRRSAPH